MELTKNQIRNRKKYEQHKLIMKNDPEYAEKRRAYFKQYHIEHKEEAKKKYNEKMNDPIYRKNFYRDRQIKNNARLEAVKRRISEQWD